MQDLFEYLRLNAVKVSVAAVSLTFILSIVYSLGVSVYISLAAFALIMIAMMIMVVSIQLNVFPEFFRAIKVLPKE